MRIRSQLWKVQVDREGESTLVFKVPLSDLSAVQELMTYVETELTLEILTHDQAEE